MNAAETEAHDEDSTAPDSSIASRPEDASSVVVPPWRVAGVSVTGTSHERSRAPCQDAHGVRVRADGTLIAAVADGAGSASRSAEGARLAVEQVLASIDSLLTLAEIDDESSLDSLGAGAGSPPGANADDTGEDTGDDTGVHASAGVLDVASSDGGMTGLLKQAVATTRACLEALATSEDLAPSSFACTLSCAVVTDDTFAVAQIGDCLVVLRESNGNYAVVLEPQRGEYANETPMLTSVGALESLAVKSVTTRASGIALLSDGLLRLAADTTTMQPHRPFFAPLFAWIDSATGDLDTTPLSAFLASERVTSRTDDDKTLVLAQRIGA